MLSFSQALIVEREVQEEVDNRSWLVRVVVSRKKLVFKNKQMV